MLWTGGVVDCYGYGPLVSVQETVSEPEAITDAIGIGFGPGRKEVPSTMSPRATRLAVPDHVGWAVEVLDPGPAETILEIGCGPGVAAALVCERLDTGRLLAVDRSPVAIKRTVQRNAMHLEAGRLAVCESALEALVVPPHSIDKVFAINVNLFWVRRPDPELAVLSRALRPDGILHVLYAATRPTGADRVTSTVSTALHAHGFTAVTIISGESGIGVSARAPGTSPAEAATSARCDLK